jgi:hypothetical protein
LAEHHCPAGLRDSDNTRSLIVDSLYAARSSRASTHF